MTEPIQTSLPAFFLGGRDLEMVTIRQLIEQSTDGTAGVCFDRSLGWSDAKSSAYASEIRRVLADGRKVVLVELTDDLGLTSGPDHARVQPIDHHNERAGKDVPTSLEQVFAMLDRPANEWTRWHALVAANDRGHVRAMLALDPPATVDELRQVRSADRAAQGIGPEEEAAGRLAAAAAERLFGGCLTLVNLPQHDRVATVTDVLDRDLGGPGYADLVIFGRTETTFFGDCAVITRLQRRFPGGWSGGEMPERGFWGIPVRLDRDELIASIRSHYEGGQL